MDDGWIMRNSHKVDSRTIVLRSILYTFVWILQLSRANHGGQGVMSPQTQDNLISSNFLLLQCVPKKWDWRNLEYILYSYKSISRRSIAIPFGMEKLEWWLSVLPDGKKRGYIQRCRQNTGVWQTDRQKFCDGFVRAVHTRRAIKTETRRAIALTLGIVFLRASSTKALTSGKHGCVHV